MGNREAGLQNVLSQRDLTNQSNMDKRINKWNKALLFIEKNIEY